MEKPPKKEENEKNNKPEESLLEKEFSTDIEKTAENIKEIAEKILKEDEEEN